MDDILRSIKEEENEDLLERVNSLHPNLKFTVEKESESQLPFLDMIIERRDGRLTSGWYQKPTDTEFCLSCYACAPQKYKRNTIQAMVKRITKVCSTWQKFHDGLTHAKDIWEANQYPPSFFNPIVRHTLEKSLRGKIPSAESSETKNKNDKTERKVLILQYRCKLSDKLSEKIRKSAPVNVIFTTRKLKTALPRLKPVTPKELSSRVIYQFTCSSCNACYVGQTSRHLKTRVNEHLEEKTPVGQQIRICGSWHS